MANVSQFRSLGRFLYTQNPFYLISCFLVLYGLQTVNKGSSDLRQQSLFLCTSIAAYTLLMAVTVITAIRLGRVWDDARSIFLVVIISLVALSSSFDELCIVDWNTACCLLGVGLCFAIVVSETILVSCRLRFPFWIRLSYYAVFVSFFALPLLLGYGVAHRWTQLTNWGSMLFSTLVALSLLLLAPAMRYGHWWLRANGSPWRWPLYPLSVFVILIVLALIRSHGIWMSFGYIGSPVRFEPFLTLPIAWAICVLLAEVDAGRRKSFFALTTMFLSPLMLLCGISRQGLTNLPIQADLSYYCGAATTVSFIAVIGFFVYLFVRRVAMAEHGIAIGLIAASCLATLPQVAISVGFKPWMLVAMGSMAYLVICFSRAASDVLWLATAASSTLAIIMAGRSYGFQTEGWIAGGGFLVLSSMFIGLCFATELATVLRILAASAIGMAVGVIIVRDVSWFHSSMTYAALLGICGLTLAYIPFVKRMGWVYLLGLEAASVAALLLWHGYDSGAIKIANLPIQSGIACFIIGSSITLAKTNAHRQFLPSRRRIPSLLLYKRGF